MTAQANKPSRKPLDPYFESQAERVVRKLGGCSHMSHIAFETGVKLDKTIISRWTAPLDERGGTGGLIPTEHMLTVLTVARYEGILLTSEDLDPRPRRRETPHSNQPLARSKVPII